MEPRILNEGKTISLINGAVFKYKATERLKVK